jgi:hypothetical protein
VEVDPDSYCGRLPDGAGRRPFRAAILTAEPVAAVREGSADATEHGRAYERTMAGTVLSRDQIERLRAGHDLGANADEAAREIARNIAHAPFEKLAVEEGKLLLSLGDHAAARQQFLAVTGRWNADWRSVYRSFHFLAHLGRLAGDTAECARYRELLRSANPHFPEDAWPAGLGN